MVINYFIKILYHYEKEVITMKNYIKPVFEYVQLRTEERLAGSICAVTPSGSCPIPNT